MVERYCGQKLFSPSCFRFYICKLLLAITCVAHGQGEGNIWYFGSNAGLDFNTGNPVVTSGGMVSTYEGSAVISDAAGNLLFYTDGITIWDRNHLAMPNGTGLLGDLSSSQSSLIIQKPGSSTVYYVFTLDNQGEANGLRYSEVDMTLNSGLGDVTSNKNVLLHTPTTEKITAVKHCNNEDIWVITHDCNTDVFRCFLVTGQGINLTPVLSNVGVQHSASALNVNAVGYMKASPRGNKLALGIYGIDIFEVFDFNNGTGIVSNPITFTNYTDAYGVEFSPDGTKLYMAGVFMGSLWQVDLCAGDSLSIVSSAVQVGMPSFPGGMQLAPDGKIYVTLYNSSWLGVINNPDAPGTACNYVNNAVSIAPASCQIGLPNMPAWNFYTPPQPSIVSNINCQEGSFSFTMPSSPHSVGCNTSSQTGVISISWNFGDTASGNDNTASGTSADHTFSTPGAYDVQMIVSYTCYTDTIISRVVVPDCGLRVSVPDTQLCPGACADLVVSISGGKPPYTYAWSHGLGNSIGTNTVCPVKTTAYTITVTDCTGTSVTDTAVVVMHPSPQAAFTVKEDPHASFNNISFIDQSSGADGWSWSFGDEWNTTSTSQHPLCSYSGTGTYSVTLIASNTYGCTDTTIQEVDVQPEYTFYVPNAFTPNGDGLNDSFFPSGTGINYDDFRMFIYNRWGELIYQTDDAPWDGRVVGSPEVAQQGVYVWKVVTRDISQKQHEYTGHVSLLR